MSSPIGLRSPLGLFNLPAESTLVEDADEEIMELYMSLAGQSSSSENADGEYKEGDSGGLGFLDSNSSILELELVLHPPTLQPASSAATASNRNSRTGRRHRDAPMAKEIKLDIKVQQDLTALKGRNGDTGSVLWRSSLHLARHILTQQHFPPSAPLIDKLVLQQTNVLELGSGTGLLAILLAPFCRQVTASDQLDNLKLVQRNIELNKTLLAGNTVLVEEVDWVHISENRQRIGSAHPTRRSSSYGRSQEQEQPYGLILAVDCIYNESLVKPLVDTLATYCPGGGRTVVWVVVELRSSEVLTLFLETWMTDPSGPWTIYRLPEDAMGTWEGKRSRWVAWVGWKQIQAE